MTTRADVLARVQVDENGCWIWLGPRLPNGYGAIHVKPRTRLVHRVAYELFVGPIPSGLVLDHLCRVRHCCNPEHLEPVTMRENILRGENQVARFATAEACIHGHPFTPENTYRRRGRPGRNCRTCVRINMARHRARRRTVAGAR